MKGATSIQERLWELRKDKGLNLEELSKLTGNYIFIYSHTILPSSSVPQDKDPALTLHKPELSSLYLPSPVEDTDDTV